ncbi:GNAT family N-acetyltransferase [Gracilibacillus phocaeensis]|uniref:GNAT family N-acetyltransferase n=1 Tax=Gracilibacillus phocaeensis TaxID=2042304 RepID=UPI0010319AFB|nr:GNAT family N-acetyltransferase [Gracilibacillus phocaeensis]
MSNNTFLEATPWDRRNFAIATYQLTEYREEALQETNKVEGHFTIKVDPFADKSILQQYGFYYVDTLSEPFCKREHFLADRAGDITFTKDYDNDQVLTIAEGAFQGGRYHRDFNVPNDLADLRYRNWVKDLIDQDLILAYVQQGNVDGFFAYQEEHVLLMAMHKRVRGKGFATPFAAACLQEQWERTDADKLITSISPSNPASLNVFLGVGFRMGPCKDIYHKVNGSVGGD